MSAGFDCASLVDVDMPGVGAYRTLSSAYEPVYYGSVGLSAAYHKEYISFRYAAGFEDFSACGFAERVLTIAGSGEGIGFAKGT